MTYNALSSFITTPIFQGYQLFKVFPQESASHIRIQLSRFVKRGQLVRLKQGIYLFPHRNIDNLVIASILYQPSYVSLETALNIYGILPDIPAQVTSITSITPNSYQTPRGTYTYSCVNTSLYYGYSVKLDESSQLHYHLAEPEKALLDWMYLRKIKKLDGYRIDSTHIDKTRLLTLSEPFPNWIKKGIV